MFSTIIAAALLNNIIIRDLTFELKPVVMPMLSMPMLSEVAFSPQSNTLYGKVSRGEQTQIRGLNTTLALGGLCEEQMLDDVGQLQWENPSEIGALLGAELPDHMSDQLVHWVLFGCK